MEQVGQAKESSDQMDLSGWNSDLDSSPLNFWNDNNETNTRGASEPMPKDTKDNGKSTSHGISWDGNLNRWSRLPPFGDYEAATSDKSKFLEQAATKPATAHAAVSEISSITSGSKDGGGSSAELSDDRFSQAKKRRTPDPSAPHLHPQAIQSSATCPSHSSSNKMLPPNYFPHSSQQTNQGQNLFGMNLSQAITNSNVANVAASLAASLHQPPNHGASSSVSSSQSQQILSSLATNFMLARNSSNAVAAHPGPVTGVQQTVPTSNSGTRTSPKHTTIRASKKSKKNKKSGSSSSSRPSRQQTQPPPFYLFDAPIELRANFIQNQRRLGIPVQHDCNSYHYGEAVKGFHPQHLLSEQHGNKPSQRHRTPRVQLIDARHAVHRNSGRAKNEREQKRAQKITELIDQLRVNMEQGGWQVELKSKSKYHTLSSCADYVKHMVETMKEKEEAVNKLRAELTVKQRNMEEDKAVQESRSDPESVASSLTTSTTGSSLVNLKTYQHKKRIAESEDSDHHKKHRKINISSVSTNEDSSEDRGSRGPSAQSFCIDKTVSSVSSSNNSGSGGSCSGGGRTGQEQPIRVSADEFTQPSSSSISSDAAVASENSSRDHHKDVVFNNVKRAGLKRPPEEVASLERSFELDYEEVFDNSNTPQLIAGTSGKIVTWNRCFLKATGLSESDVERMTIFSLVKPNKLANFFEIVAEALRSNDDPSYPSSLRSKEKPRDEDTESAKSSNESQPSNEPQGRQWNYAAMTLPCIDFPAMKARRAAGNPDTSEIDPLHVTITLMADQDPRKRCFHCTFTNCPGTDGALGTITPDLLVALFKPPESSNTKSSSRRKYKRARIQENNEMNPEESRSSQQQEEESPLDEVGEMEVESVGQ